MSLSEYVDHVQRKYVILFPCFVTTCLIKAGGFLFTRPLRKAPDMLA